MPKPRRLKTAETTIAPVRPRHPTHSFTLVYPGDLDDIGDVGIDALYEAGCDDALIGSSKGCIKIDFERDAPTFRMALLSAILYVEISGVGLELVRVEPLTDS